MRTRPTQTDHNSERERGAVIVELALAIPMFVVLVLGITHFALSLNVKQGIQAAAREGARVAALGPDHGGTVAEVRDRTRDALAGVNVDASSVTVTVTTCPNGSDEARVVVGPVNRAFSIPVTGQSIDFDLTAEATFRCEVQ